jgi:hypothetical protein
MRGRRDGAVRGCGALAKARLILPADAGVGPVMEVRTNAIMTVRTPEAKSEHKVRRNLPDSCF